MIHCCQTAKVLCGNIIRKTRHDGLCSMSRIHSGSSVLYNFSKSLSNFNYIGLIKPTVNATHVPVILQTQPRRDYAARKGTRARKASQKVKKVEVKQPFVFSHLKKLAELPYKTQRPRDDSDKPEAVDDVYFIRRFRSRAYDFDECIQMLRETHHPTVYNVPNAPVHLRVNLDMKYPNRATKCMDGWRSVVEMKSPFLLDGMTRPAVLAFCIEDIDFIASIKEGGADLAGGKELIKAIQSGDLNPEEFEYIVAHPTVVPELAAIRGLIKRKFPNVKNRTISPDLIPEIQRLKSGIKIHVLKNDREPDFAYLETPIGTLNMDGLAENFKSIMRDTLPRRISGKAPEDFVVSCVLNTPGHGFEELKVDLSSIFEEVEIDRQRKAAARAAEFADD